MLSIKLHCSARDKIILFMIRIMEISFFLKYKKCQAVHFCNTVPLKLVHPSHFKKKKVLPLLSRNITEPLITHFTLRPCHKLQVNKWQGRQLHGIFSVNQPFNQSHLVQSQVVLVLQNAPKNWNIEDTNINELKKSPSLLLKNDLKVCVKALDRFP